MTESNSRHRLAAILAADVVGYSRLMALDESATVAALDTARSAFRTQIESSRGRVIDMAGDSVLAVFDSATGAVSAALAVQEALENAARAVPDERKMRYRVGVHLGDVIEKPDGTVYGDGVNLASRLQSLAPPGGIAVSDAVQSAIRNRLALTFVDRGESEVKNLGSLHWYEMKTAVTIVPDVVMSQRQVARRDRPSVAVLPFANMSGDPEQEYFADGISEDVITELSRFHSIFVIARNSSFTYRGQAIDVRKVAKDLGVRYVLEGSVRRAGNRIRVTAQLVDAATARHVWAERYDRNLVDLFAVQDDITRSIIGAIAPGIVMAEIQHSQSKTAAELDTWDRIMRAHWHIRRFTREDFSEARQSIEELLRHEPTTRSPSATWRSRSTSPPSSAGWTLRPTRWAAWASWRSARSRPTTRMRPRTRRWRSTTSSRDDTTPRYDDSRAPSSSTRTRASRTDTSASSMRSEATLIARSKTFAKRCG
jgi:adenylate cyclase